MFEKLLYIGIPILIIVAVANSCLSSKPESKYDMQESYLAEIVHQLEKANDKLEEIDNKLQSIDHNIWSIEFDVTTKIK